MERSIPRTVTETSSSGTMEIGLEESVPYSATESLVGELLKSVLQSQKTKTEQWLSLGKTKGVARKKMLSCYTREISCEKCLNNK